MESIWEVHRLNLVSSTGDDHRRLRKLLGACFSPLSIRRSQSVIGTMTERLLHSLQVAQGSSSSLLLDDQQFAKQFNAFTLDVIFEICFGRDPRPLLEKDPELEKSFLCMMEGFGEYFMCYFVGLLLLFFFFFFLIFFLKKKKKKKNEFKKVVESQLFPLCGDMV
jgi:cytochrome P450